MATLKLIDDAVQFRVEIEGRFAGDVVDEVRTYWNFILGEVAARRFIVDISQLSGYDSQGFLLLQAMQDHGTVIAARNARALTFLTEISTPESLRPTLVYKTVTEKKPQQPGPRSRAAASGE